MKLDFFNAIQAHQRWKQRLMDCVCDPCDDNLDPGLKAQDDRCDLGRGSLRCVPVSRCSPPMPASSSPG